VNLNFDHHQYKGGDSAFRLVAKYFGIDKIASMIFPWWEFKSRLDTEGPFALAKSMNIEGSTFMQTIDPLGSFLIKRFETDCDEHGRVSEATVELVREFGYYLLEQIEKVAARLNLLDEVAEGTNLHHNEKVISLIVHEIEEEPSLALNLWHDMQGLKGGVSVIFDDRGPGLCLYRHDDDPSVNFAKLDGHPDVAFAHKGGFICKTKTRDCNWNELIKIAMS
jgi:hypothetical protein